MPLYIPFDCPNSRLSHSSLLFSSPLATEKKLDQHRRQSSTSLITVDRACRNVVYLSKKSRPPIFPFFYTEKKLWSLILLIRKSPATEYRLAQGSQFSVVQVRN
ncbi:hypothetical protein ACSBR2_001883 [Camellia fascicularis]